MSAPSGLQPLRRDYGYDYFDNTGICKSLLRVSRVDSSVTLAAEDAKGGEMKREIFEDRQMLVPDSTTNQLEEKLSFSSGDDVFVKQKDGRYYLGTVIKKDQNEECWLVRFGDETERWAYGQELQPLESPSSQDKALCVVCKSRAGDAEVLTCNKCGRGYHRNCHYPLLTNAIIEVDTWKCRRCLDYIQANKVRIPKKSLQKAPKFKKPQKMLSKLPYDLDLLHWDSQHRANNENVYCYCGSNGDWFSQMLQCVRCLQWFHQKCISCLKYPLYTGDRFYFFSCSVCNYGTEFIRRLELDWVDLVHLMLFNLTAYNGKKYYDLDRVIIPYIADNWHALQLPKKLLSSNQNQRREYIIGALNTNRNRFKCGKEIKKKTNIWGLRMRAPPPTSYMGPPPSGPLTEQMISGKWSIIPESNSPSGDHKMFIEIDHWNSIMTGKKYQSAINSDNDSIRSTPSPIPMELNTSSTTTFYSSKTRYSSESKERNSSPYRFKDEIVCDEQPTTSIKKAKNLKFYEMDYQEGGFIKKAVPFPKLSLTKRNKILDYITHKRDRSDEDEETASLHKSKKFARTRKILRNTLTIKEEKIDDEDEEDKYSKPSIITKTLSVSISSCDEILAKQKEFLPPTPPTSVSNPPTPPASLGNAPSETRTAEESVDSTKAKDEERLTAAVQERLKTPEKIKTSPLRSHTRRVAAMNLEISKLSTKNIIEHSKIMSLHHNDAYSLYARRSNEHDSSDDTSSRGTLDAIIPPPVNFQGKNNPFHQQSLCSTKTTIRSSFSITNRKFGKGCLLGNLNPMLGPVVRPLKRQLSEKDLIIGPNGEVKRKRLRRPRKKEIQQKQLTLLKEVIANDKQRNLRTSAANQDEGANGDQTNSSFGENGRCLRQRTEKNYCDNSRRSSTSSVTNFQQPNTVPSTGVKTLNLSPKKSPFKNGPSTEATRELKTSVLGYFGASNRITAGEKFSILGRRVTENGKAQFLIEWEGHRS